MGMSGRYNRALVLLASLAVAAPVIAQADPRWPPLDSTEPCEAVAAYRLTSDGPVYSIPWDKLDGAKAIDVCRRSLQEHPDSDRLQFLLARAFLKAERFAEAAALLDTLSAKGYIPADLLLAHAIAESWITSRAPEEALPHLRKAAEADIPEAQLELADDLSLGHIGPVDVKSAVPWYERSAQAGIPDAGIELAQILETGDSGVLDFAKAEQLQRSAIAQSSAGNFASSAKKAMAETQLAWTLNTGGRFDEAEPLLLDAVAGVSGRNWISLQVAALTQLADVYNNEGRTREAIKAANQGLTILAHLDQTDAVKEAHAALTGMRAEAHALEGYYGAAENDYDELLRYYYDRPPAEPNDSAYLYERYGRFALDGDLKNAEKSFSAAIQRRDAQMGGDTPYDIRAVAGLAEVKTRQGDFQAADALFAEALAKLNAFDFPTSPEIANGLTAFARVKAHLGDAKLARDLIVRGLAPYIERSHRLSAALSPSSLSERKMAKSAILRAIEALDEIDGAIWKPEDLERSFELAQFATGQSAGLDIAAFALRMTAGDKTRADALRQIIELQRSERRLSLSLFGNAASANPAALAKSLLELHVAQSRSEELARTADISKLLSFLDPKPISIKAAQSALKPGQALIAFAIDGQAGYAWLVRPDNVRVARLDITSRVLQDGVTRLRHMASAGELADAEVLQDGLDAGRDLYRRLFGTLEPDLDGIEHLIVVPDAALQDLPIEMLLTADRPDLSSVDDSDDPESAAAIDSKAKVNRETSWLIRKFAVSYVPSVDAFVRLSELSPSEGRRAFLGVANPIYPEDWNVPSLPETEGEVRELARLIDPQQSDLMLGEGADEEKFKAAALSDYRIIALSTHGAMAGDLGAESESALALMPSPDGKEDGILQASEIAALTLDADLVILSACDTATPDGILDVDGFSGLARAFFHAGARSVLATQWEVDSESSIRITTGMLGALSSVGGDRALALRQSILALIDGKENAAWTSPRHWAPFVLIGL
jgi:CHAT domain-containing protein/TPR repeat protein